METLNKLKINGDPKTTFELAVELLKSELDFSITDFLDFAIEIEKNFKKALRS